MTFWTLRENIQCVCPVLKCCFGTPESAKDLTDLKERPFEYYTFEHTEQLNVTIIHTLSCKLQIFNSVFWLCI